MKLFTSRLASIGAVATTVVVSFGLAYAIASRSNNPNAAPAANPMTTARPSESSATVPKLPIGEIPKIDDWRDISLPVDNFREDPSARNTILSAEYVETEKCMKRYGMTFTAPEWKVPTTNTDYQRLFGLVDLDAAQEFGYHTGETLMKDGEAVPSTKEPEDPNASTPGYMDAFMGSPDKAVIVNGKTVPKGGCVTEAREKLGDSFAAEGLVEQAVNYGLTQSDADARVIAAFASWSSCLKDAGFSYATPMDANNDPRWATATATPIEIRAATADVKCKIRTNLTGLRVAVASAWQTKYLDAHKKEFIAAASDTRRQLEKAASVAK